MLVHNTKGSSVSIENGAHQTSCILAQGADPGPHESPNLCIALALLFYGLDIHGSQLAYE